MNGAMLLQHAAGVVEPARRVRRAGGAVRAVAPRWSLTLGTRIRPAQVVLCLIDLKLARLARDPKHLDSRSTWPATRRSCGRSADDRAGRLPLVLGTYPKAAQRRPTTTRSPSSTAGGQEATGKRTDQSPQGARPSARGRSARRTPMAGSGLTIWTIDTLWPAAEEGGINSHEAMHDAARDFQANFILASFDPLRALPVLRVPGTGHEPEINERQLEARRGVHRALEALGGVSSPGRARASGT